MAIVHPLDPSTEPEDEIRTDLWNYMSLSELGRQQDMLIDRLTQVQVMMGTGHTQTLMDMYLAMQHIMKSLSVLIESKSKGNFNA